MTIVIGIQTFIIGLLIIIFGYPFFLEYTNQLVDIFIENNIVIIDSPLYKTKIDLDNVNKVELTDDITYITNDDIKNANQIYQQIKEAAKENFIDTYQSINSAPSIAQ